MPIFQDPNLLISNSKDNFKTSPTSPAIATVMRKPSEESIRTEFCDGPEPDPPGWIKTLEKKAADMASREDDNRTSDRAELIERIKRGESPTWVPTQALEEEYLKHGGQRLSSPTQSIRRTGHFLPVLPLLDIPKSEATSQSPPQTVLSPPLEIQRPRSALHSGNFTEGSDDPRQDVSKPQRNHSDNLNRLSEGALGTSPTTPWYSPVPPWRQSDVQADTRTGGREADSTWTERRPFRSRAPSLQSYSSSYILKAPTTPLVQQSNSTDLDMSAVSPIDLSESSMESPMKGNRRHTLPPHVLSASAATDPSSSQSAYQPWVGRMDERPPYQRHHQRRSLTSALQITSSPQSPRPPSSRRQSNSSEISVRQRASMVGSYEESILRGSMSTAPSKPLDFTAQIGVLGKDDCKPKCPAHITVSFPAVFYSYGGTNQSVAIEPSPYVGEIDLQDHLPPAAEKGRRKRRHSPVMQVDEIRHASAEPVPDQYDGHGETPQARKRKKRRERSPSPAAPPGGSYRIPQKGQLQIIIKNPNKTAVKLFLVPYDLTGMGSGTKTFIRQRSYCSGTSTEDALGSRKDESSQSPSSFQTSKKPTLRYLIHLNICCPSRGRFYLYHGIRVVFANRVPDNKEQLQNDIQLPDPRFSAYKPMRESLTPRSSLSSQLAADKGYRRRSTGFGSESEAIGTRYTQSLSGYSNHLYGSATPTPPVPPIPFDLAMPRGRPNADVPDANISRPSTATESLSPMSDRKGDARAQAFGSLKSDSSNGSDPYAKLNKADVSNGGLYGRPSTPEPGEGLLARKLRGFDFRRGEVFEDD